MRRSIARAVAYAGTAAGLALLTLPTWRSLLGVPTNDQEDGSVVVVALRDDARLDLQLTLSPATATGMDQRATLALGPQGSDWLRSPAYVFSRGAWPRSPTTA